MTGLKTVPVRRGANYDKLTVKQKLFCDAILADPSFNSVAAARAAGYRVPHGAAARLLRQKRIQAIIGKHIHERLSNLQLNAEDVLRHLTTALFLDPLELMNKVGANRYEVRNLEDVPLEIRRCITKMKCRTRVHQDHSRETIIEIELMSKDACMSHALKHFGLISPDGHTTNVNIGISFQDLLERAEQSRNDNGRVVDAEFIRHLAEE